MADETEKYGLVGVGGDLGPATLLAAYRQGIFPWYNEGMPICWWSPDPRAIFELDTFRPSTRLARTVRQRRFTHTFDKAFSEVMAGCGEARAEGTWITAEMKTAYAEFHKVGYAHSVETWLGDKLVGGLYGVAIGGLFAADSMFHRETDASKVALVHLVNHLRERGFVLLDSQILNPHTQSLGAIEIPRIEYLRRLRRAVKLKVTFLEEGHQATPHPTEDA